MTRIRFTQDESNKGNYEPLPKGDYEFEIVEVEERTSSNDNPQVMLKMEVVGGPYGGKKATAFYTLTPKAAWRFRALCEALGWQFQSQGKDQDGNDLFEGPDPEELVGKHVVFKVTTREYEGQENNDFNKPRAPGAITAGRAQPQPGPAQPAPQGFAPPQGGFAPPQGQPGYVPPQGVQPGGWGPPQGQPQPTGQQGQPGPAAGAVDRRARPQGQ